MSKSLFADLANASADQQGVRRTALFLHGLHPQDRDLLMREVPTGQRAQLEALLRELGELGIPPAAAAENDLVRLDGAPTRMIAQAGVPVGEELDADWLGRADAQVVCTVLTGEPDALIARVLRLNAWAWKGAVLAALDEDRRRAVGELLLDPAHRHREHGRLDEALLRQLRHEVERHQALPLEWNSSADGGPRLQKGLRGLLWKWARVRTARRTA